MMSNYMNTSIGKDWRAELLILLTAGFLLFWSLGSRGFWGSEGRWAEVSREMLLTGDFFHPRIGGDPYFDKPLLTYWFITGISAMTGVLNEWVVRLPSAIFGFICVFATFLLGKQIWSFKVGLLASWFMLTSYGLVLWSRTAAADTENLAAVTLCILWYWVRRDKLNFVTFVIFYLIAFLGALTKGLTAVVVPFIAIVPDLIMEKRWKVLFGLSHILALGVSLAVYLSPFIYASMTSPEDYQSSGLALVFQENIQRFFQPIDHKNPFYIYFYAVPMLVLPWAPILVVSIAGLLPVWKSIGRKTQWLMAAMGIVFLFFTLSGSRRGYYILPILPLCALLMAVFLTFIVHQRVVLLRYWGIKIQKVFCIGLIVAEAVIPFALLFLNMRSHFDFFTKLGLSGIIVAGAALLGYAIANRLMRKQDSYTQDVRSLAGPIAATAVVFAGFFLWQQPIIDTFRTERLFIEKVKAQANGLPASSIGVFPKNNATLLFYLNRPEPITVVKTASDWNSFLSGKTPKVVIMQSRSIEKVPLDCGWFLQKQPDIAENTQPWDSKSSRRGKWRAWIIEGNTSTVGYVSRSKEYQTRAN
jgi:4-amino-4-deoxy-L-arabinose transferase-like glycosyltransferase